MAFATCICRQVKTGISETNLIRLIKAARTVQGPIYIHCHHGKHRGPAAAALVCLGTGHWDIPQALRWMKEAGTATNYAGLYRTVREFQAPSERILEQANDTFPEASVVSALVDAMVEIGERWDHLKEIRTAGFKSPTANPDLDPAHEALMLLELFRETARLDESKKQDQDYLSFLQQGVLTLEELHRLLSQNMPSVPKENLEQAFQRVARSCRTCHDQYRN